MKGILATVKGWPYSSLAIDVSLLHLLHSRVVRDGNQYGFGDKVDLVADSSVVRAESVDCSGYSRWLIYRATNNTTDIGEGSVTQHDNIISAGFKKSTIADALNKDGAVRIAFLSPNALYEGAPGHVAIIHEGFTMESHGGTGPDTREWNPYGPRWMRLCSVYVLTPPSEEDKTA